MSDVEMSEAPEPVSPSDQLTKEAALAENLPTRSEVAVTKPIPYTFDIGNLLLNDANPVPSNPSPVTLLETGRDCAQALINQLLTVLPITSSEGGVYITLPTPSTPMPREKSIPKEKEPTKWERFAAKKGIQAKKRDGKLIFDEASGEWVPRYGYKGANKAGENDWLVEVDMDKEKRTGEAGDARREKRAERMEKMKRQDRKMRANQKRGKPSPLG
jgi:regulator of ribosome biosynthesis